MIVEFFMWSLSFAFKALVRSDVAAGVGRSGCPAAGAAWNGGIVEGRAHVAF